MYESTNPLKINTQSPLASPPLLNCRQPCCISGTVCAPPRRPAPPTPPWPTHAACSRSALLHSLPQHGPHLPSFSNPSCILQPQLPYRPSSAAKARRPSDRGRWSAHASTTCNTRSRHGSLSIYLASRTTCTFLSATGPCQPSLSLSLYRLGDRRSHSHMLMHCFSCQHAQKIWDDKLWCWLSCRIMHWISLIFSLMLCTPISQSPQHRAVEAALSSSKIAFTLQIASLQRLYRSFCPVWFCTYFASTSIYHGNMTLQCPGVGGRGRSPLIRMDESTWTYKYILIILKYMPILATMLVISIWHPTKYHYILADFQ